MLADPFRGRRLVHVTRGDGEHRQRRIRLLRNKSKPIEHKEQATPRKAARLLPSTNA
jgi:hypothetical protein